MNYQELVEELSKVAAQIATTTTLKTIEEQRQADAKAIKDRRIHNTKLLLRKYRLFNEHIGSSTFKESQINLMLRGSLAFTQTSLGQFARIHIGVSLLDKHAGVAFVACGILTGYRGMLVLCSAVCPDYDSEALKAGVFAFCAEVSKRYGRVDDVYVDAEEYTLQQELKRYAPRYGVNAKMRLAANLNESDLIRLTNSMFQRGMLQLTSDCRELSMAFSSAIYADKNDKERKVNNINLLRAFEYALERDSSRFAKV